MVISAISNGLKESVKERVGRFNSEHTYVDPSDIQLTLTNGGALTCKTILFSNWSPLSTMDADEQQLRKSIELFLSKSMEFISKDQNPTSIAFAVCDSCRDDCSSQNTTRIKEFTHENHLSSITRTTIIAYSKGRSR